MIDHSKNRVNDETMSSLRARPCLEARESRCAAMFAGEAINLSTEGRAVLHVVLRNSGIAAVLYTVAGQ